jgi:hypothetical protein
LPDENDPGRVFMSIVIMTEAAGWPGPEIIAIRRKYFITEKN